MPRVTPMQEALTLLDRLTTAAEKVAQNTNPASYHVPVVFHRADGSWGTMCYACSRDQGAEVPHDEDLPADVNGPWPPAELFPNVNDLAVKQLETVRRLAAGMLLDTPAGDPRQFFAQSILAVLTTEE